MLVHHKPHHGHHIKAKDEPICTTKDFGSCQRHHIQTHLKKIDLMSRKTLGYPQNQPQHQNTFHVPCQQPWANQQLAYCVILCDACNIIPSTTVCIATNWKVSWRDRSWADSNWPDRNRPDRNECGCSTGSLHPTFSEPYHIQVVRQLQDYQLPVYCSVAESQQYHLPTMSSSVCKAVPYQLNIKTQMLLSGCFGNWTSSLQSILQFAFRPSNASSSFSVQLQTAKFCTFFVLFRTVQGWSLAKEELKSRRKHRHLVLDHLGTCTFSQVQHTKNA